MKLTPFQAYAQAQGVFVHKKKDEQIAAELSKKLSGLLITYAVASRSSGKRMDVVVEIGRRWMHTAYGVTPDAEGLREAYEVAKENHRRIFTLTQEAV